MTDAMNTLVPVRDTEDLKFYGQVIQESGILKCKTAMEGIAVFLMCREQGMSLMQWNERYHMVKGQISKKTQAIQADFQKAGGEIEIHSHTADCASATFSYGKTSFKSVVDWESVKSEPFPYVGKEDEVIAALQSGKPVKLKAKYATPRSRAQMLWARCVSDGVRVVYPAACEGVYTPEETDDFAVAPSIPAVPSPPLPSAASVSPSPFNDTPAALSVMPPDIDIITVRGSLYGQRYSAQPKETLEWALKSDAKPIVDALTPEVRAHIEKLLAVKEV